MLKRLTRSLLPLVILVILGAVTFINALPNSFHYDDFPTIVQNGAIRKLTRIPSYFVETSTWTVSRLRDWRPMVLTTFARAVVHSASVSSPISPVTQVW